MTAEKASTSALQKLVESCPTPLRATLRAPPSKWAIEAFFRRVSAANCPEGKRGPSVGPWAQPKATRREGGRRAERPVVSYATPDTPCSRTAPEGSLPTERGQTVPALRPELDDPNLFGSSNRSATAGRSPRPREAEGRLAPEMAESHEARSQAQAQRRAWPQCIAMWAAFGVAVPLAFFCTLFFRHRKKSVSAPWDGKSHSRAGVERVGPRQKKISTNMAFTDTVRNFSAGKQSARPELPCTLAAAPEHFPLQKTNAPQDSNFPSTP